MNRARIALAALLALLLVPGRTEARLVARGLVLHGATKTQESTLRALTGLQPGAPVDFALLEDAERRLAQSDLFMSGKVWLDLPPEEAARRMDAAEATEVDVHVTVVEKQSWFAVPVGSVGAGDLAIGAVVVEQNLAGRGLQALGAGQYGESKSFVVAGLRQPLSSFAPLTWSVLGIWRLETFRYYQDHRLVFHVPTRMWGGDVKLGWVATPTLRLTAGLLYHRVDVFAPGADEPAVAAPAYNPRSGNHLLAQVHLVYDSTIAPQGLREGARFTLFNELSDGVFGSDFDYFKLDLKLELYGKWRQTWPSLLLRLTVLHPTSARGVPVNEQLRAGGPDLRGFNTYEFRGDVVGTLQLEEQIPLVSDLPVPLTEKTINLALATFADFGLVLERNPGGMPAPPGASPAKVGLHAGLGVGARVVLPGIAIPVLKIDLAYGIDVKALAVTLAVAGGTI